MKRSMNILLVTIGFTLAGCGGGNNGVGTDMPQAPTPTVLSTTIVTQAPTINYGLGTVARDAVEYLNSQRLACGFGTLDQSTQIDIAAQAHSDYIKINNVVPGHYEDKAIYPTGFTGATPDVRIAATGYPVANGAGSETIGYASVFTYGTTIGKATIMGLFAVPYHGFGMLQGDRDIGIGFNPTTTELTVNFAYSIARTKQLIASNVTATYPCQGTAGVLSKSHTGEIPTPIAGRDLRTNPIGHPIYLKVRDGQTLTLSSLELRKVGETTTVPTYLLSKSTDIANLFRDNSNVVVIPTVPLDTNSSYTFTANGTNTTAVGNVQPVNLSFTFSTGTF